VSTGPRSAPENPSSQGPGWLERTRARLGSNEPFRGLVESLADLVLLVGADYSVLYQSPSVTAVLGTLPEVLTEDAIARLGPSSEHVMLDVLVAESVRRPGEPVRGTVRAYDVTGALRTFEVTLTNQLEAPALRGVIVVLHDITERTVLEAELRHHALRDTITGLPNRSLLLDRIEQLLASARGKHLPVSVVYIDIDRFQTVNDALGRAVGDALLMAIGQRLVGTMSGVDTVYRVGDDEFVVLSGLSAGTAPGEFIAERLQHVLRSSFQVGDNEVYVSASIGVATSHTTDAEELVRRAEIAMSQAKESGVGAIVTYAPAMQAAVSERLQLATDLRRAVQNGEISVLYQPTIHLRGRAVHSVEALVRWDHPTRGHLSPNVFVSLAEETGLIEEIGRYVLRDACAMANELGELDEKILVAVNLSARQLDSDRLIADVAEAIETHRIDPNRIILEVTESAVMVDPQSVARRFVALKHLGVRLAIDDFGTGYSSLSYLRHFPVDILKIDRSFVAGLTEDPASGAIVHALIELGRTLALEIIAEGVETTTQLRALEAENCDVAQGYLFSKPMDAEALVRFVDERASASSPPAEELQFDLGAGDDPQDAASP
jgi:diguanylate cyclase (GGDEF)-like protein/PAS domain S-box-containing protein